MIPVRFSNKIVTDRDSFLLEMAKKDNCSSSSSSSSSILQSNTGLIKNVVMCYTKKLILVWFLLLSRTTYKYIVIA